MPTIEIMDYGEYWLLETAVKFGVLLYLVPESRRTREMCYNGQWNKRPHMLSVEQLVETFLRLHASGDITITTVDKKRPEDIPSRTELKSALTSVPRDARSFMRSKLYKLTPKGGARWETFTQADWNRYYSRDSEENDEGIGHMEIATASEQHTERVYSFIAKDLEIQPMAGTEVRTQLSPWQATYWKTLPRGFLLSVRFRRLPDQDVERRIEEYEQQYSPEEKRQQREAWKTEYCYLNHWYKKHPDTPSSKK